MHKAKPRLGPMHGGKIVAKQGGGSLRELKARNQPLVSGQGSVSATHWDGAGPGRWSAADPLTSQRATGKVAPT